VRLIERYVLKRLFVAFFATLVGLAGVVWVTQALRELNLVTAKGQTILVFLEVLAT
jgi:lipopolysaccharide export system permease protein